MGLGASAAVSRWQRCVDKFKNFGYQFRSALIGSRGLSDGSCWTSFVYVEYVRRWVLILVEEQIFFQITMDISDCDGLEFIHENSKCTAKLWFERVEDLTKIQDAFNRQYGLTRSMNYAN